MKRLRKSIAAICETLESRLFLSADPGVAGLAALSPSVQLLSLGDVSPATADGTVYFVGVIFHQGFTLYKTDGTAAGTAVVSPLSMGVQSTQQFLPIVPFGNSVFISAGDNPNFTVSDGTAAGTHLVTVPETAISDAVSVQNTVYFIGTPLVAGSGSSGLWRTDGTTAGTVQLTDREPLDMTAVGARLEFFTSGTDGLKLWSTDGTVTGTQELAQMSAAANAPAPHVHAITAIGNVLYFVNLNTSDAQSDGELWTSDGTAAGSNSVGGTITDAASFSLYVTGGRLLATGNQVFDQVDVQDGALTSLMPATVGRYTFDGVQNVYALDDGRLMFHPYLLGSSPGDGTTTALWWTTDGTPQGTASIGPAVFPQPANESVEDYELPLTLTPFADGLIANEQFGNSAAADYVDLEYFSSEQTTVEQVVNGSELSLYDATDLSVAAKSLVFLVTPTVDDPNPQIYALGNASVGASTSSPTPPTATLGPDSVGTDGTFSITIADSTGFTLPDFSLAIVVTVADKPVNGDPGFTNGIYSGSTVPVSVVSTASNDGGKTYDVTYQIQPIAGVAYQVQTGSRRFYDTLGLPLAQATLGYVRPSAAVPAEPSTTLSLTSPAPAVAGTEITVNLPFAPDNYEVSTTLDIVLTQTSNELQSTDPVAAHITVPEQKFKKHGKFLTSQLVSFVLPRDTAPGTYFLGARYGDTDVLLNGLAMTVVASRIDVSATVVTAPKQLHTGRKQTARIRLTNDGNVDAIGTISLNAASASSGVSAGSNTRRVKLRPGQSIVLPVHFVPRGGSVSVQLLPDPTWSDLDLTDKIITLS